MFDLRVASRSWIQNGLLGLASMLAGLAFLVWPQLAILILAGTLGVNLLFLGGYLVWTAAEQKRLEDVSARVHRISEPVWSYRVASRWPGAW